VRAGYRLWLDRWPEERGIRLPLGQIAEVTAVQYYPLAGEPVELGGQVYQVVTGDRGGVFLYPGENWPAAVLRPARGISVDFTAGWAARGDVPKVLRQAALLLVSKLYDGFDAGDEGARIDQAVRALVVNLYPVGGLS